MEVKKRSQSHEIFRRKNERGGDGGIFFFFFLSGKANMPFEKGDKFHPEGSNLNR